MLSRRSLPRNRSNLRSWTRSTSRGCARFVATLSPPPGLDPAVSWTGVPDVASTAPSPVQLAELETYPSWSSREADKERRAETVHAADRLRATLDSARGCGDAGGAGDDGPGAESASEAFASRLASSTAQHRQASLAAPMVQTVGDPGFEQARKELEQQLLAKYGLEGGGTEPSSHATGGTADAGDAREEPDAAAEAGAAERGGGEALTGAGSDGLDDLEVCAAARGVGTGPRAAAHPSPLRCHPRAGVREATRLPAGAGSRAGLGDGSWRGWEGGRGERFRGDQGGRLRRWRT